VGETLGVAESNLERDRASQRRFLDQRARRQQPRLIEQREGCLRLVDGQDRTLDKRQVGTELGRLRQGLYCGQRILRRLLLTENVGEHAVRQAAIRVVLAKLRQRHLDGRRIAAAHRVDEQRAQIERFGQLGGIRDAKPRIGHFQQLALHRQRRMVATGDAILNQLERPHHLERLEAAFGMRGSRKSGRQQGHAGTGGQPACGHSPTSSRISMRRLDAAKESAASLSLRSE
jgi:hypothetical protein